MKEETKCYCGHTTTCDCGPEQETLEEAIERLFIHYPESSGYKKAALIGKEWQQERSYSEEEVGELVYNIVGEYGKHYGIMIDGAKLDEWFKQFKK